MERSGDDLYGLGDSLISLLEKERSLYSALRLTLCDERRALGAASAEDITRITAEKQVLVSDAETLEDERSGVLRATAQCLGLDPQELTISRLLPFLEEGQRNRLQACRERLLPLAAEVRSLNDRNKDLLASSLLLVRDLLNFITSAASASSGYVDTGRAKRVPGSGRLLQREG